MIKDAQLFPKTPNFFQRCPNFFAPRATLHFIKTRNKPRSWSFKFVVQISLTCFPIIDVHTALDGRNDDFIKKSFLLQQLNYVVFSSFHVRFRGYLLPIVVITSNPYWILRGRDHGGGETVDAELGVGKSIYPIMFPQ